MKKYIFLALSIIWLLVPTVIYSQKIIVSYVYESNWGPLYLAFFEDNSWTSVYENDSNWGIITGSAEDFVLHGTWIEYGPWNNYVNQGPLKLTFSENMQSFSGEWRFQNGEYGGIWSGTFVRQFSSRDEEFFFSRIHKYREMSTDS